MCSNDARPENEVGTMPVCVKTSRARECCLNTWMWDVFRLCTIFLAGIVHVVYCKTSVPAKPADAACSVMRYEKSKRHHRYSSGDVLDVLGKCENVMYSICCQKRGI